MKTIVVDDEQRTRQHVCRILEAEGFEARQFETADSVAAALSEATCEVDLVVTDVHMPGPMDGVHLATMVAMIRLSLSVVVMSSDPGELQRAIDLGLDVPTLVKPFGKVELLAAVADARRRRSVPRQARVGGGLPDRLPRWAADPRPALGGMFHEARVANHPHVGSEHVALAALDGPGGFAEIAVQARLDPAGLRPSLLNCCSRPPRDGEVGLTSRAATLVAVAAQFALLDGSRAIRPCDLVAALMGAPQAMAWAGLTAAGLDYGLVAETRLRAVAAFAVEAIRRWWRTMGQPLYPDTSRLLVTADAGGSNGSRLRLWKWELQRLADETGLEIAVCHFPPGTSKWNKIEHRLFAAITQNWRGKPLVSHETVVNLIAATTTRTGLRVRSELDTSDYPAGIRVSDADMKTLHHQPDAFHGEWNYSLLPRQRLPLTEAVIS